MNRRDALKAATLALVPTIKPVTEEPFGWVARYKVNKKDNDWGSGWFFKQGVPHCLPGGKEVTAEEYAHFYAEQLSASEIYNRPFAALKIVDSQVEPVYLSGHKTIGWLFACTNIFHGTREFTFHDADKDGTGWFSTDPKKDTAQYMAEYKAREAPYVISIDKSAFPVYRRD